MGLFFMIIFFIINLASITWIWRIVRFKKCLPPFGPPAYHHYLSSSCQTFISEGQLLCSDPSFVRFLSFPFTHDSHTQEPKVFVSIVFLSRIFVVVVFITFSRGYLPIVELVLRRVRNFYIAFMSPRFHYYFYYYYL